MKRKIYSLNPMKGKWLCCMALAATLVSCEMESSDNGALDGFWHLEQVDTLATGGSADYRNLKVYWGIEHQLVSVSNHDMMHNWRGYYFRFKQSGDSLILSSPYRNKWHQQNGGDIPVTEMSDTLSYCGFTALEEHFYKEKLTSQTMILRNKVVRLKFTKF